MYKVKPMQLSASWFALIGISAVRITQIRNSNASPKRIKSTTHLVYTWNSTV